MPLYDAVYPTMMYYQDKLGGTTLSSATVCGYDNDLFSEMEELEDRLKVPVRGMEPRNTEDIYKPALGAAGFCMGQFDLNLSTRPFKPYRAANFGLLTLLLILLTVSAGQVLSYQQYYLARSCQSPGRTGSPRRHRYGDGRRPEAEREKMTSGNATAKLSEVETAERILIRKKLFMDQGVREP
jgi:hypothetical protein